MSLENLTGQLQAILEARREVTGRVGKLNELLNDLSEPIRIGVLQEILEEEDAIDAWEARWLRLAPTGNYPAMPQPNPFEEAATELPPPSDVVRAVLQEHTDGLSLPAIIQATRGRFKTSSNDPDHVVRTIIGQMRKEGDVIRDDYGLHKLRIPVASGDDPIPF